MGKLRVALGSVYPYDESRIRGGVESVALYLTRALSRHDDIELHVVSFNRQVRQEALEQRGNVTFHWLPAAKNFYALRATTVYAWKVRQIYNQIKPDIIHAQGFSEYAIGARATDTLLLAIHGVEVFSPAMKNMTEFRGPAGLYRRLITMWMARQSLDRARSVISNAGDYTRLVLGGWLKGKPVVDIFNPIADEFFTLPPAVLHQSPVVLAAGTLIPRKNILGLVNAFHQVLQKIPDAELRIAGEAVDPAYFQQVQKLVDDLGLAHRVHFLGVLDRQHLLQEYRDCSVFALSSFQETAPMVVGSAMAASRPVVATRVCGLPWMVEDGISGYLVGAEDTNAFAQRLINLLQDPDQRLRMGKAAHAAALQKFSAQSVAEQTIQLYRTLVRARDTITV